MLWEFSVTQIDGQFRAFEKSTEPKSISGMSSLASFSCRHSKACLWVSNLRGDMETFFFLKKEKSGWLKYISSKSQHPSSIVLPPMSCRSLLLQRQNGRNLGDAFAQTTVSTVNSFVTLHKQSAVSEPVSLLVKLGFKSLMYTIGSLKLGTTHSYDCWGNSLSRVGIMRT